MSGGLYVRTYDEAGRPVGDLGPFDNVEEARKAMARAVEHAGCCSAILQGKPFPEAAE